MDAKRTNTITHAKLAIAHTQAHKTFTTYTLYVARNVLSM